MALTPIKNRLLPHFRFVWKSASAPKARWVGGLTGFQIRGSGARELVVYLAWRGFLLWLAALVLAVYLVGTAALAYIFSRNPYNRITYFDLLLPTHWSELKGKRGQTLIDAGLHQMQTRKYGAGIMTLARGLQLAPDNIPARLVLGELYVRNGYLYKGMQLLRDGIPYAGGKRRYLDACFRLATYLEDYELVLSMVDEATASPRPDDAATRRYLRDQRVGALVKLGRYQAVIDLWRQSHDNPSLALNAAWARALAGLGRADEAIAAVEKKPDDYGVLGEPWRLLMELARQGHRPAVGREAVDKLAALDPGDYHAQVERVVYLAGIGDGKTTQAAVGDFYLRFGLNDAARVTLLKELEPSATPDVLAAAWSHVMAIGRISVPERIAYVQDLISTGDLAAADREFKVTVQLLSGNDSGYGGWMDGTRILLDLLQTGSVSARSQLQAFCNNHPLGPAAYRLLIGSLARQHRLAAARDIAVLARNRYPAIQGLPTIEPAELKDTTVGVIAQGRAADATVSNPEARIALAAMREDISSQRWADALTQISKVEKSPLAGDLEDELLYDRIIIHGQLSNQTELSWYMRRLMEQPRGFAPARLRQIANELDAAGRVDSALTLLREILRKHPEAKWAADLQQSWRDAIKGAPLEP